MWYFFQGPPYKGQKFKGPLFASVPPSTSVCEQPLMLWFFFFFFFFGSSAAVIGNKVEVNGVNIYYEKAGHGKQTVLLLPGAIGTMP